MPHPGGRAGNVLSYNGQFETSPLVAPIIGDEFQVKYNPGYVHWLLKQLAARCSRLLPNWSNLTESRPQMGALHVSRPKKCPSRIGGVCVQRGGFVSGLAHVARK